jgi:hypothetical protein
MENPTNPFAAPPTETITVTDLDVRFTGETYSGTLFPEDTLAFDDDSIRIRFAKTGEEVVIQRMPILWWSKRERQFKRPVQVGDKKEQS